jgi:hypothetical protein
MAMLEMTSLAFMFVLVPEPVWKMSTTKALSYLPSMTCEASRGALERGAQRFGAACHRSQRPARAECARRPSRGRA